MANKLFNIRMSDKELKQLDVDRLKESAKVGKVLTKTDYVKMQLFEKKTTEFYEAELRITKGTLQLFKDNNPYTIKREGTPIQFINKRLAEFRQHHKYNQTMLNNLKNHPKWVAEHQEQCTLYEKLISDHQIILEELKKERASNTSHKTKPTTNEVDT